LNENPLFSGFLQSPGHSGLSGIFLNSAWQRALPETGKAWSLGKEGTHPHSCSRRLPELLIKSRRQKPTAQGPGSLPHPFGANPVALGTVALGTFLHN